MGLEIKTRARHKQNKALGKLHLDSRSISFSSPKLKWSVELGETVKATAVDGWLVVQAGRDKAEFEIGAAANKWVDKILNPPSRLEKLGVKRRMKFWMDGEFSVDFMVELTHCEAVRVKKLKDCQLAFLRLTHRDGLGKLIAVAQQLPFKINIWVVWPKGVAEITQADVMQTAASSGMGPSKTASFDDRHSSLRFAKKPVG